MREMDWSGTPLGPATSWSPALRTIVSLMLASNQPMYVVWGSTRAFLYNDHYAPFLGVKHPAALGRDLLLEVWPEIRERARSARHFGAARRARAGAAHAVDPAPPRLSGGDPFLVLFCAGAGRVGRSRRHVRRMQRDHGAGSGRAPACAERCAPSRRAGEHGRGVRAVRSRLPAARGQRRSGAPGAHRTRGAARQHPLGPFSRHVGVRAWADVPAGAGRWTPGLAGALLCVPRWPGSVVRGARLSGRRGAGRFLPRHHPATPGGRAGRARRRARAARARRGGDRGHLGLVDPRQPLHGGRAFCPLVRAGRAAVPRWAAAGDGGRRHPSGRPRARGGGDCRSHGPRRSLPLRVPRAPVRRGLRLGGGQRPRRTGRAGQCRAIPGCSARPWRAPSRRGRTRPGHRAAAHLHRGRARHRVRQGPRRPPDHRQSRRG